MKLAKTTAYDFISAFRTPRFMDVVDLRLGVANRALQGVIFVYFIFLMVTFKEYELKYVPEGSSQYYMSQGTMYAEQESNATALMCIEATQQKYDYTDPDCANGDTFWCENNISCYTPMFAEATVKHDTSAWAYTYLKDSEVYKNTCDVVTGQAYCTSNLAGSIYKQHGSTNNSATSLCACEIFKNQFFKGVEGMKLTIAHQYNVDDLSQSEVNVKTRVRREGFSAVYGESEHDYKTFDAGENIALTVHELLSLSGVDDLDNPNYVAMSQYPSTNASEFASYRQTGYEILLDFSWLGSVGETIPDGSNVELILSIIGKDGYSSKGNNIVYSTYPNGNLARYNDRYFRGIKFSFNYGGSIGNFKFFNLVVVFTSFTILLSISGTIVSLVAFFLLGYSSTVYTHFGQQKVSIKRLHGKIAAQALIGGNVWRKVIDIDGDGSAGLSEISRAFENQGYNHHEAMQLAAALLSSAQEDKDTSLEDLQNFGGTLGSLVGVSTKEEVSQYGDDDIFAAVRGETINIREFCDLISEEETTLDAAMGQMKSNDDKSDSSSVGGDVEMTN